MESAFLAMVFRMKHINRWGLMYNTQMENLSVHSFECAALVHFLSNIGNVYFQKQYDCEKLATYALYHDATEVLTGDLPTPIKYYSESLRSSYKDLEHIAAQNLLNDLPEEMRAVYLPYFEPGVLSEDEKKVVKAADKLCAYIKCKQELNAGNKEFSAAYRSIKHSINAIESEEVTHFLKFYFDAFSLSLHEIKGIL